MAIEISQALSFEGLTYFYKKYIQPIKQAAYCTVVNNGTTTISNTVLDGRMGKTLADKDADLQSQINNLSRQFTTGDLKKIMIATGGVNSVQPNSTESTYIYYSCPATPKCVIPIVHGGVPLICSVNQWSSMSAQVIVFNPSYSQVTNRTIQLAIIY